MNHYSPNALAKSPSFPYDNRGSIMRFIKEGKLNATPDYLGTNVINQEDIDKFMETFTGKGSYKLSTDIEG